MTCCGLARGPPVYRPAPRLEISLAALNPNWVAVKGLNLSEYVGETTFILLTTTYTHYGNSSS